MDQRSQQQSSLFYKQDRIFTTPDGLDSQVGIGGRSNTPSLLLAVHDAGTANNRPSSSNLLMSSDDGRQVGAAATNLLLAPAKDVGSTLFFSENDTADKFVGQSVSPDDSKPPAELFSMFRRSSDEVHDDLNSDSFSNTVQSSQVNQSANVTQSALMNQQPRIMQAWPYNSGAPAAVYSLSKPTDYSKESSQSHSHRSNELSYGNAIRETNIPTSDLFTPDAAHCSAQSAPSGTYQSSTNFENVQPISRQEIASIQSSVTSSAQPNPYRIQPGRYMMSSPYPTTSLQSATGSMVTSHIPLMQSTGSLMNNLVSSMQSTFSQAGYSQYSDNLSSLVTQTPPVAHPYTPTQRHWFYCTKKLTDEGVWMPFSHFDSNRISEFAHRSNGHGVISVQGGRYDVNIESRLRSSVYCREPVSAVRWCSWFYRTEASNGKFVPYSEQFAESLEASYKNTLLSGDFHKKIILDEGATIVIHTPQVILHLSNAEVDSWGNTASDMRPRVVKRGVEDLDQIPADEMPNQIDHLVLFVHGLGGTKCKVNTSDLVDCVDDMRSLSNQMLKDHFGADPARTTQGRIGWVEFLPVCWQDVVRPNIDDVNETLNGITLRSISKLRHFTNDALLEILFYESPVYAQTILDAVADELNRIYELFMRRNSTSFSGRVFLVGHGLGSVILFDILSRQIVHGQQMSIESLYPSCTDDLHARTKQSTTVEPVFETSAHQSLLAETAAVENSSEKLSSALAQLGLSSYLEHFQKEQIDLDALRLLEDSDIKDLGLPLGPRKKLQEYMKRFTELGATSQVVDEKKRTLGSTYEQKTISQPSSHVVTGRGIGLVNLCCPQLHFSPFILFTLGSPVSLFLTVRGVQCMPIDFTLPQCPGFVNIFHPYDPMAFRIEPIINERCPPAALLIPHHKGRKRLHLELKDSLTRMGSGLKQRIIESLKMTWQSINSFATSHRAIGGSTGEESGRYDTSLSQDYLENQVDIVLGELAEEADRVQEQGATGSVDAREEVKGYQLNNGGRVDHVLQESPIEMLNEYLFAVSSHTCYWQSEDTVLLMLNNIYSTRHASINTAQTTVYSDHTHQSTLHPGPPVIRQSMIVTGDRHHAHEQQVSHEGTGLPKPLDIASTSRLSNALGPPLAPVIPTAPWQSSIALSTPLYSLPTNALQQPQRSDITTLTRSQTQQQ